MVAYNKFDSFVEHMAEKVHNLQSDTLKVMLTNTAPVRTNVLLADLTEISSGNGYVSGGNTLTVSASAQTSGTYKLTIADSVFTASGGTIGPFRYAALYNSTPTSPLKPLISWWDNGATITLNSGESCTIDFDGTNGVFQLT